jgi:hypothetical protein
MKSAVLFAASVTLALGLFGTAQAAKKFFAYNMTTASDFAGVFLAPAGTTQWGTNQALNDNDKVLDVTERLVLLGLEPGTYDVKLIDTKGHTCIKHGVVLGQERAFEVHDSDLADCH